jgi:hypothetical protein
METLFVVLVQLLSILAGRTNSFRFHVRIGRSGLWRQNQSLARMALGQLRGAKTSWDAIKPIAYLGVMGRLDSFHIPTKLNLKRPMARERSISRRATRDSRASDHYQYLLPHLGKQVGTTARIPKMRQSHFFGEAKPNPTSTLKWTRMLGRIAFMGSGPMVTNTVLMNAKMIAQNSSLVTTWAVVIQMVQDGLATI